MEVMNKLNILFLIIFCNVLISDNSKNDGSFKIEKRTLKKF